MRAYLLRPLLVALCAAGALALPRVASSVPPAQADDVSSDSGVTAFVGVDLLPMTGPEVLRDRTVLVRGDRIVTVGPRASTRVPDGARRIDGRGKFLMPGLAEMHGHVPPPNAPARQTEDVLFLYVAGGVTTVRGMLGAPGQLELRERSRGELVSPTLYLAGPSFNGQSVSSPEQAAAKVREQKEQGWDLLKVHPGLTRPEYDAMAAAAREARIAFGGHVPAEVGLLRAIEAGQETFDHLDGYVEHAGGGATPLDEAKLRDAVERTRRAGAWVVPTMALWEVLMGVPELAELTAYPELRYVSPATVEGWSGAHRRRLADPALDRAAARRTAEARLRILRELHRGGVRVLMGTDAPQQFSVPGFSLHRELAKMQEAGMTPYEILRTGTWNVGEYFRERDRFGTVVPGARADLLLLDANPLDDLDNLWKRQGVMLRGRWIPEARIQARLEQIAASHRPR